MKSDKKKRKRVICWSCVVIILLLAVTSKHNKEIPAVEVYTVREGVLEEAVPVSGKIEPVVEVAISPDVSGEIVELHFEEGDSVHKGDILLKIKQNLYRSLVEQAEASLNVLKAQQDKALAEAVNAEKILERTCCLHKSGTVSDEELENARTSDKIAKATAIAASFSIQSGEAQLKEALENLDKTTICSPIDGTVSCLNVELGERVVGTSQMAGTEIMKIADLNEMELVVNVPETGILKIKESDKATIRVDACPDSLFYGTVTKISNSSKNIGDLFNQVTNFEVRIGITSPHPYFRPGMSASADISTERRECLRVPLQSIAVDDEKRESVWVVRDDGSVHRRFVTTGIQDLHLIEVTSGLECGEMIVSGPVSAISGILKDGEKIKYERSNSDD